MAELKCAITLGENISRVNHVRPHLRYNILINILFILYILLNDS